MEVFKNEKLRYRVSYPVYSFLHEDANLDNLIQVIHEIVTSHPDKNIVIWSTGRSGLTIALIYKIKLNMEIMVECIKISTKSRHGTTHEINNNDIHIFVDDFINTGSTITSSIRYVNRTLVWDYLIVSGEVGDHAIDHLSSTKRFKMLICGGKE